MQNPGIPMPGVLSLFAEAVFLYFGYRVGHGFAHPVLDYKFEDPTEFQPREKRTRFAFVAQHRVPVSRQNAFEHRWRDMAHYYQRQGGYLFCRLFRADSPGSNALRAPSELLGAEGSAGWDKQMALRDGLHAAVEAAEDVEDAAAALAVREGRQVKTEEERHVSIKKALEGVPRPTPPEYIEYIEMTQWRTVQAAEAAMRKPELCMLVDDMKLPGGVETYLPELVAFCANDREQSWKAQ